MPANVESMFSVREKPWHGLGTIVEEAPTSLDAIKLAGLDWDVVPVPVFAEGNEVKGYKANKRSSDGTILGIVSNKYKAVQNIDAFSFTDNLIGEDVRYETAGSLNHGKRIWLLAKMPSHKILGDEIEPYMCFTNSHDGTGAIKVCMTPIRVVCNNTLNLALKDAKRIWSTKHMGNMEAKLEEAKNTLLLADKYMEELNKEAEILANTKVTKKQLDEILQDLYPVNTEDSKREQNNAARNKEIILTAYEAKDIKKFKNTAWGVMNAITDVANHAEPLRKTKDYSENNWARIIDGHKLVDTFYDKIKRLSA